MPRPPARVAAPPEDPRRAATRARIVETATRLFSLYGFRRSSVDELAAAAGVAKPTLYAYFPDKDALFRAVCEDVLDGIVARARAAADAGGTLSERVVAVLAAKFTFLFELVQSSPHAAELLGSSDRLASAAVTETDRRYAAVLGEVLSGASRAGEIDPGRAGLTAPRLIEVLLRCGHGAGYHATSAEAHRRHLTESAGVVLSAVTPERRARPTRTR